MGIPEYEAKRYEGHMKEGGILVSVHCDSSEEVGRAKDVLKQSGAHDISSAGEKAVSSHGMTDEARHSVSSTVHHGEAKVHDAVDTTTRTDDYRKKY